MLFLEEGYYIPTVFDVDHFPPRNVGETLKALGCKACNSTAGHEYGFATKGFLNELGFHKRIPFSIIETKHTITDVTVRYSGTTGIDKDGKIEFSFKLNPKHKAPPLDKFLTENLNAPTWTTELLLNRLTRC